MIATDASGGESPVRQLLGDRNFRNFWISQVLAFGINGTVRFMFVWLMVTLTDWSAAEGLIGIALGVPALLFSLPAGAWSDRVDRQKFCLVWMGASALAFALFAAVIGLDLVTPRLAGVAAVVVGSTLVIMQPNLNAIVPLLVPRERLMNAAALQNGGGQAAGFLGLAAGGGIIAGLGNAAGFALLAVVMSIAFLLMRQVTIPRAIETKAPAKLRTEIADGLRYGLGREPSRSLLITSLILGSSFSVMQIAMPRVVEEEFGRGSLEAGLLLGMFAIGMLTSSIFVARRQGMRHGLNVAVFIGVGLGLGQLLLSLAPNYWAAMAIMVGWGINAGIAIASHRTLLQQQTEPEMMGRVMGIMTLGFSGGLPFGALTQAVVAPAVGPVLTMRYVGIATVAITAPLLLRSAVRTR
jgi:MFS family permease